MQSNNSIHPPDKKRTGCGGVISFFIGLVVIIIAGGVIIGAIYGMEDGNIWGGISSTFSSVRNSISGLFSNSSTSSTGTASITATPYATSTQAPDTLTTSNPSTNTAGGIDPDSGIYNNLYLGLVKTPDGVISGNCYGEFIVLINNKAAKNPTYSELIQFLKLDETDEFPYQFSLSVSGFYYGDAEDQIDLTNIKNIVDGLSNPEPPAVCADFAERLHNNAERSGIRCGYVSLDSPNHALNVFETTDKGIVYIDDTGSWISGPDNCDKLVDLHEGQEYVPVSLFPEYGWEDTWESMVVVSGIFITWDGNWRN